MMKEPWQVFYELYREFFEAGREDAVMKAADATIWDWIERNERASGEAMAGMVAVVHAWSSADGPKDWGLLRQRLQDAWADYRLRA